MNQNLRRCPSADRMIHSNSRLELPEQFADLEPHFCRLEDLIRERRYAATAGEKNRFFLEGTKIEWMLMDSADCMTSVASRSEHIRLKSAPESSTCTHRRWLSKHEARLLCLKSAASLSIEHDDDVGNVLS